MKKILIIGSKGMAGHVIYNYFKENTDFNVIDIARGSDFHKSTHQIDVTDFEALLHVLKVEKPDVVVNCIGILNKDAEDNPDKAILLNSYFPHFLAKAGETIGFKLIHISTDCVFNGKKGGYAEDSIKDGIGFYAQSKAMGEVSYGNHLTLRTSIIGPELNPHGIGLFHWFMLQKGSIKGYRQAYWSGITTLELAKAIAEAIVQDISGLHHLVNGEKINKYELTGLFNFIFRENELIIEPFDGYQVDKSLVKTNHSFNYAVPSYEDMLSELKVWMEKHKDIYAFYLV
jgi:dTDP-4-dehydrorhamnose reductase